MGIQIRARIWEAKCHKKVVSEGFELIGDPGEWRSCYVHKRLGVMLVIYVDDFKMGGPEGNCHTCWSALRSGDDAIQMDDPTTIKAYLGCTHRTYPLKSKRDGKQIALWNTS